MTGFFRSLSRICFCISAMICPKGYGIEDYFVASIPKSGTHLLLKVFELFDEYEIPYHKMLIQRHVTGENPNLIIDHELAPIAHKVRKLIMIRDLRDSCLSAVFYFSDPNWIARLKKEPHIWGDRSDWINADFKQRLLMATEDRNPPWHRMFCRSLAALEELQRLPNETLIIRFEDLVGPQGGGSRAKQIDTIYKISQFVGATITDNEIHKVADNLFGNSKTFNSGMIGGWKNHYEECHKKSFKQTYGDFLIKYNYDVDDKW